VASRSRLLIHNTSDLVDFLYHGKPVTPGAVWISFDDGYKDWLDTIVPLIRQRNVPVTLLFRRYCGGHGLLPWMHNGHTRTNIGRDAVTVNQLKTIARYPQVTIGGHTVNHAVTENLPEPQARFELGTANVPWKLGLAPLSVASHTLWDFTTATKGSS